MFYHEAAVHERGSSNGQRQRSEINREQCAGAVGLLKDLLGRANVSDERRKNASGGDGVSERDTNPQDFQDSSAYDPRGERSPMGDWQSFRMAKCKPCEQDRSNREKGGENRAPASQPLDSLSEGRGNSWNEDEYGHRERHETGHSASFVLIAQQRYGYDARSRGANALQYTACDHHFERWCKDAHDTSCHEQDKTGIYRRLASDSVRKRTESDLTEAEAQKKSRDDELYIVAVRCSEVLADRGQRRQHCVCGERDE